MPYRRLPTTDKARLRAMNVALDKAAKNIIIQLPFSEYMLDKLMSLRNNFVITQKQHHAYISNYKNNRKKYNEHLEMARLFLSHYIQNVYMSIERKEMQKKALEFYGLEKAQKAPSLANEMDILDWGEKILTGDKERIQKGGSSIYNPSIAMVRIKLEEFNDQLIYQQNLEKTIKRSKENIEKLRTTTNEFIAELWDMIEKNVGGKDEEEKRELAEAYGVVYVFRKRELKKLQQQSTNESKVENDNYLLKVKGEIENISDSISDVNKFKNKKQKTQKKYSSNNNNLTPENNNEVVQSDQNEKKVSHPKTVELTFDFFNN